MNPHDSTSPLTYRPEIKQPLHHRIAALPVYNGYPVPWFVAIRDGQPDPRLTDHRKLLAAIAGRKCWVCGDPLGNRVTFVTGPLAVMIRRHAEPPSHRECATFAAQNCPFLVKPHIRRRPDPSVVHDTNSLTYNPGVAALWTTRTFDVYQERDAWGEPVSILFNLGNPESVEWFTEGRAASRTEVEDACKRTFLKTFQRITSGPHTAADIAEAEKAAISAEQFFPPHDLAFSLS